MGTLQCPTPRLIVRSNKVRIMELSAANRHRLPLDPVGGCVAGEGTDVSVEEMSVCIVDLSQWLFSCGMNHFLSFNNPTKRPRKAADRQ